MNGMNSLEVPHEMISVAQIKIEPSLNYKNTFWPVHPGNLKTYQDLNFSLFKELPTFQENLVFQVTKVNMR